jgi:hypothetical protein
MRVDAGLRVVADLTIPERVSDAVQSTRSELRPIGRQWRARPSPTAG